MNNNILTNIKASSVFISGAEDEEAATAAEGRDVAEADIEAAGMVEAAREEEETGVAVERGDSLKQMLFSMVLVFAKIGLPPKEIQGMCQGKGSRWFPLRCSPSTNVHVWWGWNGTLGYRCIGI